MSSNTTRRSLVAAAPAAALVGSLPASADATGSDAELLALREPWQRSLAALAICGPAHTRAENALADARRAQSSQFREDIQKEVGLDVAEAHRNAAVDANTDILDQIAATPARTINGLLFKAQACAKADYYPHLADAIIDDLVAMGGAHA